MRVLSVFGTRPEVIKMAPVILELKKRKGIESFVLSLGQHRELLDQMTGTFDIKPDLDLNIMKPNQTLPKLTADLMIPLDDALKHFRPDFVVAQGDTTSTFMTALAAAYQKIPFGHVEAGLRTYNRNHPYPEEMNRVLVSHISAQHYAPTILSKENLVKEGIDPNTIFVTGNTVIDALFMILAKNPPAYSGIDPSKRLVVVTLHRRENWDRLEGILEALIELTINFKDIQILFPVHPNPNVNAIAYNTLKGNSQITLTTPMDYVTFVATLKKAALIISDSGGIQEEAPSLKVPVLVVREFTERPEAVNAGVSKLVGTLKESIVKHAKSLLSDESERIKMIKEISPFGDGKAAIKIVDKIINKNKTSTS